ncbi:hypothetical protein AOLI_G00282300 [Acnodon oligacanthus]
MRAGVQTGREGGRAVPCLNPSAADRMEASHSHTGRVSQSSGPGIGPSATREPEKINEAQNRSTRVRAPYEEEEEEEEE